MKMFVKDPAFSGVANGQRATASLPIGWTYHQVNIIARKVGGVLLTAAEIAAGIGEIFVKKDGVAFIEGVPASVLRDIYGYYFNERSQSAGILQDGIIPLTFAMPNFGTPFERDAYSLGTNNISSLTVEASITSAVPVTLEIQSIKDASDRPFGAHLAIRPHNDSFSGTGVYETAKMPKDTLGAAYRASFIYAADIKDVTVFVNNERIIEELPKELNIMRELQSGRTPIANVYTIDYGLDNVPNDVLPLPVADLRHRFDFGTQPDSFVIYNTFIEGM